jgi:hypothetical protein
MCAHRSQTCDPRQSTRRGRQPASRRIHQKAGSITVWVRNLDLKNQRRSAAGTKQRATRPSWSSGSRRSRHRVTHPSATMKNDVIRCVQAASASMLASPISARVLRESCTRRHANHRARASSSDSRAYCLSSCELKTKAGDAARSKPAHQPATRWRSPKKKQNTATAPTPHPTEKRRRIGKLRVACSPVRRRA